MVDRAHLLELLAEAERGIDGVARSVDPQEIGAAVRSAAAGVEEALRSWLRSDHDTPADLRVLAGSPTALSRQELLDAVRRQGLASLELAGMTHELFGAAERAERGEVREGDLDLARRAVQRCRGELARTDSTAAVGDAAHRAVAARALDPTPQPVPPRRRIPAPLLLGGAVVGLLAVIALVAILLIGRGPDMAGAVADFRSGRHAEAEAGFREIVERNPRQVTARLYLARIYRREGRYEEAAAVLREARDEAPSDPGVRRELGHLLMELDRPRAAADQYRRAVELEPNRALNWIGLVRAMRAAGDPRAEDMLRRAPAAARAALQREQ